ncbi:tetratricopeptide repeat protein [Yoonia sp.]|uniref:tetratricopeptide repeat protein n=1 Tax=Yoonia sp. TaxID=2212373 RepID=UPI002E0AB147|nr:tetratricopeptide repeat protein [Yoonia sp.]
MEISCWGLLKTDESLSAFERAVALNPNCSLAYGSLGTLLGILGRSDEAMANQEIAIRSSPLDPSIFFRFLGLALAHDMAGHYATATNGRSARSTGCRGGFSRTLSWPRAMRR